MPKATVMGEDILHENGRCEDVHCYTKFFAELANDCFFSCFAELDRTSKWAYPLHSSCVIKNLSSEQPIPAPMKAQGFQSDSG